MATKQATPPREALSDLITAYIANGMQTTTQSMWWGNQRITVTLSPCRMPWTLERITGELWVRVGSVHAHDEVPASIAIRVARAMGLEVQGAPVPDMGQWVVQCVWRVESEVA